MGRRAREDSPGAWHHVMNRGVAKRPLFEDREDARFFLARLARQVRLGRVEVHAYCLMTTHFHLLLRSPIGELSEAMRRVQNEHSRRFNRRRKRDGTLIRGRYTSKPVRSLTYRRTLVAYIDGNPVKAGLVRTSVDYRLGSAHDYARSSGPKWLSRQWVEGEVCALMQTERFSAAAYLGAFGGGTTVESDELIAARLASTALDDPLDDLIGAAPSHVRDWMQRKAMLADGCRVGLPVCGRRALELALAEDSDTGVPWMVEDGTRILRGVELARAGMQRDLCGLGWRAIAEPEAGSISRVTGRVETHRRLLGTDPDYAERTSRIAQVAMNRSLGPLVVRSRMVCR